MRPAATIATETAGLMWQPEIGPTAYAIAVTARPNANAMPTMFTAVAPVPPVPIVAAPQPTSTSTAVPNASARYLRAAPFIFPSIAAQDEARGPDAVKLYRLPSPIRRIGAEPRRGASRGRRRDRGTQFFSAGQADKVPDNPFESTARPLSCRPPRVEEAPHAPLLLQCPGRIRSRRRRGGRGAARCRGRPGRGAGHRGGTPRRASGRARHRA